MSEPAKKKPVIKTNFKRCPYLKITTKVIKTVSKGVVEEITTEEFNDCYKSFCMAWDADAEICRYLKNDVDGEDDDD